MFTGLTSVGERAKLHYMLFLSKIKAAPLAFGLAYRFMLVLISHKREFHSVGLAPKKALMSCVQMCLNPEVDNPIVPEE